MNSFNNNFEKQFKKQIDERELTPSRDLWAEIQAQTENSVSGKSKFNWVYMAACFVVIFGLGAVLFFDNDAEPKSQLAETVNIPSQKQENPVESEEINSNEIISEKEEEKLAETKNIPSQEKTVQEIQTQSNLPLIKENPSEVASQIIIQNQPAKIMAKSDSVQVKKKKKFVDSSTLLFSIEHKDVIEKSKDGSNVATIDLNNK